MKKNVIAVMTVCVVLILGLACSAFAAEGKSCCAASKPACGASQTPACAAQCPGDVKVTMSGKMDVTTEKVDGKDAQVAYLTVSDAKADDGKTCCAKMKDQCIKITGKDAECAPLSGKTVEVKGTCMGKEIQAASVAEKK